VSSFFEVGMGPSGVVCAIFFMQSVAQSGESRKCGKVADMVVTVNGVPQDVPEGLTVRGLVEHLGLTEGPVAVEVNRLVVPRASHVERRVEAGDAIEIVHFVGGG
jgi:sulfur carrier protein